MSTSVTKDTNVNLTPSVTMDSHMTTTTDITMETYVTNTTHVSMTTNLIFVCYYATGVGNKVMYFVLIFSFIIILESTIVIATIWRTPALHSNTDIIVASMSVSDILLGLSFSIQSTQNIVFTDLDQAKQNIVSSFLLGDTYGACLTSITHLGFAAIDRYIRLSHPFYYARCMTKRRNFNILLIVWGLGIVYTSIPLVAYTDTKYHRDCIISHPPAEYYLGMFVVYIINIIAIFASYLNIAYLAFQHKKAAIIRRQQHEDTNSDKIYNQNRTAAMRSVKFFAIMFGVFIICTAPPIALVGFQYFYNINEKLSMTVSLFLLINSLINCLIYAFMSREFSRTVKATFKDLRVRLTKF